MLYRNTKRVWVTAAAAAALVVAYAAAQAPVGLKG